MRTLRILTLPALVALAAAVLVAGPVGAHDRRGKAKGHHSKVLKANLKGASEVPGPGDPDGRGKARVRVLPGMGAVCFRLSWRNIAAPTAAHIHEGEKGVAGPIVVGLFAGEAKEKGCVEGLDADLLRRIKRQPRQFYVNVHNADFPDGAIRGQLKKSGRHRGNQKRSGAKKRS